MTRSETVLLNAVHQLRGTAGVAGQGGGMAPAADLTLDEPAGTSDRAGPHGAHRLQARRSPADARDVAFKGVRAAIRSGPGARAVSDGLTEPLLWQQAGHRREDVRGRLGTGRRGVCSFCKIPPPVKDRE